jgi:HK97 family phage major capsid protein
MKFLFNNPMSVIMEAQPNTGEPGGGGSAAVPETITKAELDTILEQTITPLVTKLFSTLEDKIKAINFVTPSQKDVDLQNNGGFADLGAFTQAVVKFGKKASLDPKVKALLETRVGENGGILVPPEFSNHLFTLAQEKSVIWNRITRLPVNGNSVEFPAISDYSHASDTYYGGIQNIWVQEGSTVTQTQPKFDKIALRLKDNMTIIPVTNDLLEDSPVTIAPMIETMATNALAMAMDNVIINGSGVGKPLGILNSACKIEVSKETDQKAATIVAENIIKMFARFNMRYLRDAIWMGNQTILAQLPMLNLPSGTAGALLYMPPNGLAGSPLGTILGLPLAYTEFCKALGTAGDLILWAPSQYLAIDKSAQSAWSKEVYFLYNESVLRIVYRVDGQMWHIKPMTPANGDTLSPVVTLATRA